ncbi:MAG: TonB-dependent receptor [Salinivirgaceae bacterium]|nr:TonB-dependent receptor [Salinivirgaceae bacterium]
MNKKILGAMAATMVSSLLFGQTDTVNIQEVNKQTFFVTEDPTQVKIQEVVVTGTRNPIDIRHLPMTVTVVGQAELERHNQTSILPAVMQQVPGLFVTSRAVMGYGVSGGGSGAINIRGIGGSPNTDVLVLIDGHPQYQGIFGHPISDSYQTMMTERVEVLRGPASVLYGSNAMGGVISIVTRSMKEDGIRTSLNIGGGSHGTLMAETSNQIRSGKFSSTVSAEYNRSDNHRPNMEFEQYGGYVRLGYDIAEHWNAYADADITHFDSKYPGSTTEPIYGAEQWILRGVMTAAVENKYERTSGAVSVYSNFGNHKIDDGTKVDTLKTDRYFRSKDALTGVSVYQSAQLFVGNRVTVGFDYQHIFGDAYYTNKNTDTVMTIPNKQTAKSTRHEVAGYVDFRQDLTDWLTVDAGIRLDHHSVTGSEWVPQAGVVVRPMATAEVKAMVSKGFRNPTMREMYLYPPSNEDLEAVRLWNYELSWRHRAGKLAYGANVYYLKADNMIQTQPVDGKPRNVNTGELENYGVEFDAAYTLNEHWSLNTNHSYLHMENKVVAAPEYTGFLGANCNYGKLALMAGLQYVNNLYTVVGQNEETETFCLLNLSGSYRITKNISVWARGENLLGQEYEINAGYPMPKATVMGGLKFEF